MRLLFIGDAFARPGLHMIESHVPRLRDELELDFVVANGENLADGAGITSRLARRVLAAGVDVITLGNHALRQREIYPYLNTEPRIVRPANFARKAPGHFHTVCEDRNGYRLGVVTMMGSLFLEPAVAPFEIAEDLITKLRADSDALLLDFHAEATSEKIAIARLLAGKLTAVIGTHTHVQTNDARVLTGGTAFMTDAGMTGPHDSVIGVRTDLILARFATGAPVRFEPADGDVRLEGALIEFEPSGRATAIEAFRLSE
jgi:metallophosphoesterase (TIGR00282 family)